MTELLFRNESALLGAAVSALKRGLLRSRPSVRFDRGYPHHVMDGRDNLVQPELLARFRAQFESGAGGELEPRRHRGRQLPAKMKAVRSSSALALNLFGPWSADSEDLMVGSHIGFAPPEFERRLTPVSGRQPPHLDVFLQGDRTSLGIEVKCLEYLSKPDNEFADAYRQIPNDDPRRRSTWFAHMAAIGGYERLHAAQLVKHYFGLAQLRARPLTLLYLYWMPTNWAEIRVCGPNGASVNPFEKHREEIARFSDAVANDEATGVRFESMSTLDLFARWAALRGRDWLGAHLEALKTRYAVGLRSAPAEPLSPEFIQHLIEIGESGRFRKIYRLRRRFPRLNLRDVLSLLPEPWFEVAESISPDEAVALIKALTVMERRLLGSSANSVSPLIWLRYKAAPRWSTEQCEFVRVWLRDHSKNFYAGGTP